MTLSVERRGTTCRHAPAGLERGRRATRRAQLAKDPVMRAVIARHGPCDLTPRRRSPYETLTRAIAHQQLNGRAAETILGRFVALFPKNGRFPSPGAVLAVRPSALRRVGFS